MHFKQLKDSQQDISLAPSLVDILRRSHDLLLQSRKTIYFLNASTLFSVIPTQELLLKATAFESLVTRLRFLNSIFDKHQMLFYLSRMPNAAVFSATSESDSLKVVTDTLNASLTPAPVSSSQLPSVAVCTFLQHILRQISEQEQWNHLQIVDVLPASHLDETDGSLNADEVVNTLVRCFKTKMVDSHKSPDLAVVQQIWKCFKEEALEEFLQLSHQAREDTSAETEIDFYPIFWISKIVFRDYLLEEDEVEVPHPILIQRFGDVAKLMAEKGVLVQFSAQNHSDICIQLTLPDGNIYTLLPPPDLFDQSSNTQNKRKDGDELTSLFQLPTKGPDPVIRCPHYAQLFKFIESNFITNPPANYWSPGYSLDLQHYQHAAHMLESLRPKLEAEIADRWAKIVTEEDKRPYVDTIFWLMEDWASSLTILQQKHEKSMEFPLSFNLPPSTLQKMVDAGYLVPGTKDSATIVLVHAVV